MKTLFIGGVKSGKSSLAERYILEHSPNIKPLYLATTEFVDEEMQIRIQQHKQRRYETFTTVEIPLDIHGAIENSKGTVLIECTTMWINNMLFHKQTKEQIINHISAVLKLPNTIVFVHNDVGAGIIPDNALARAYVDISGTVSQMIASECDEVYHCVAGIATKIKG